PLGPQEWKRLGTPEAEAMESKPMMQASIPRLLVSLALAALPWLCGCEPGTRAAPSAKNQEPTEVKSVRAVRGEIIRSVTLPGEIKPNQQATLYAKITGYLKTISVDKGDLVKEGALLAEIEAPELGADAVKFKAEADLAEIDY